MQVKYLNHARGAIEPLLAIRMHLMLLALPYGTLLGIVLAGDLLPKSGGCRRGCGCRGPRRWFRDRLTCLVPLLVELVVATGTASVRSQLVH